MRTKPDIALDKIIILLRLLHKEIYIANRELLIWLLGEYAIDYSIERGKAMVDMII